MPVYKLHGFQWPRAGIPSIRVFIVLENIDDAAAEYIQQKKTSDLILGAIRKNHPNVQKYLPDLQLIEQYDPEDTSDAAVSQPHAFVADTVTILPDTARPMHGLSMKLEQEEPLNKLISSEAETTLAEVRDAIAPGQQIGWWIVYNGDPERYYPGMEADLDDEAGGESHISPQVQSPELVSSLSSQDPVCV